MEFGIVIIVIAVGLFVIQLFQTPKTPLDKALQSLRENAQVRAEHIVEKAHKAAVKRHGAASIQAGRAGVDLARIRLMVGDVKHAREAVDVAFDVLREKEAPELIEAIAQRALLIKAQSDEVPAFMDLEWLSDAQVTALGAACIIAAKAGPHALAEGMVRDAQAFVKGRVGDEGTEVFDATIQDAKDRAALAPILAQQAAEAQAAEASGDCSSGGCGSGPKGKVEPEFSRMFAEILNELVPEGTLAGVEMRREGDHLTPRVSVARKLNTTEERTLSTAIETAMKTLQEKIMSEPKYATPTGELDAEATKIFAGILEPLVPAGLVMGVEMYKEGDTMTPRIGLSRELEGDEEKVLSAAVNTAMMTLRDKLMGDAHAEDEDSTCCGHCH